MYHYNIVDEQGTVVLTSMNIEGFEGYSTVGKAYLYGLQSKSVNKLPSSYRVIVLSPFEFDSPFEMTNWIRSHVRDKKIQERLLMEGVLYKRKYGKYKIMIDKKILDYE